MRKCSDMPYHTGIVLRIYPSRRQKQTIAVNSGCFRAVYNKLVALNKERYNLSKSVGLVPAYAFRLSYLEEVLKTGGRSLASRLQNIMPYLYLPDVDSQAVANAIKNYNTAWKNYRKNPSSGVPQFHKKSYEQSYQTSAHYKTDAFEINDGNVRFEDAHHITLPKLGRIRFKGSAKRVKALMNRTLTRIGTVTISCDSVGCYYASLQIESERPFVYRFEKTGSMTGIDVNIDNFLWDSNNNVIDNPKFRRNEQEQIAKLQRSMARKRERAKKEGRPLYSCKNYQKDRIRLSKLYKRVANRADNFRHTVAKMYVKNHDYIFAEDLKVSSLLKNHRLAMAISECGWYDFMLKLEQKAELYDKVFAKVSPRNTTQTCSECGHVLKGDEKLTLSDREWVCPVCGAYHVRDYNAAKNIMAKGVESLGLPRV